MHAVQFVHALHHACLQHLRRATGRQLLRVLEQEPHLALEAGPLRRKQLSRRKLHGRMAIVAAGIAVALKEIYEYFASCAQASMDFESAITGVAKTTDLTDEELAAMSDSIKALSTEIPATTEEIAAVA